MFGLSGQNSGRVVPALAYQMLALARLGGLLFELEEMKVEFKKKKKFDFEKS